MGATLIFVWLLLVLLLLCFLGKSWKRSKLPGPTGLPFLGQAIQMVRLTTKDILPLFKEWSDKYGGMFEMRLIGRSYIFVTEPEEIERVLSSSTNITKGYFEYSLLRPMFKDGLLLSDGDKWRSRRKMLTPSFHFKILESSLNGIYRNAKVFVEHLLASGGELTDLEELLSLTSLKILCETAMGVKLNIDDVQQTEYIKAVNMCCDMIVERFMRFWQFPEFIYRLCRAGKQFFKNVEKIENFDKQVINERKKLLAAKNNKVFNNGIENNGRRKAFLDTLLELNDSYPGLFKESDIVEEVDTFMLSGHHTIVSALLFAQFLLANHPEVQKRVYEEQIEIFGDDERMPTIQDLKKMIYLEMVIKETLRLYPVVPFYTRSITEDLPIDERRVIKAGQFVFVVNYAVHRSKKHWENPDDFIPERFSPGIERHPFSFIPFSAGPRNCIGQKYAMMELKMMLSTILRHCWLEPITTSVNLDYGITLKPDRPILIKVIPRDRSTPLIHYRNI